MIKILFLGSSPRDQVKLRLDKEVRGIQEELRSAEFRDQLQLEQRWAVQPRDLTGLLLQLKPTIVHFSGHSDETEGLILEDEQGHSMPVASAALQELFSLSYVRNAVRCVVLNACFTESQAKSLAQSIDCVIGTGNEISDKTATLFAAGFYQGIGYGLSVKDAFDSAKAHAHLGNAHKAPVVFIERIKDTTGNQVLLDKQQPGPVDADRIALAALQANPSRPQARKALETIFRSDVAFTEFVMDYFGHVARRYSSGMDRIAKTNLLFEEIDTAKLIEALVERQKLKHS